MTMFNFERWIGYQGFLEQDLNEGIHYFSTLDIPRINIIKVFVWVKGEEFCNIYFTRNGKLSILTGTNYPNTRVIRIGCRIVDIIHPRTRMIANSLLELTGFEIVLK